MPDISPKNVARIAKDIEKFGDLELRKRAAALLRAQAQRLQELEDQQENASQAMAETHNSWEARCHAIMAALDQDFGGFSTEVPDVGSWYEVNSKRLKGQLEDALIAKVEANLETVKAGETAINEAVPLVKEAISKIVYDCWYKNDFPVTSHSHQKVGEAAEAAMKSVLKLQF